MLQEQSNPGQVVTFYSFKGGTGRSMALANVACLLRENAPDCKILIIDWDLEAPGIDRYFNQYFHDECGKGKSYWERYKVRTGLLDFFEAAASHLEQARAKSTDSGPPSGEEVIAEINPDAYWIKTDLPGLFLMKAGRSDSAYGSRVNTFDWEALYKACPSLFRAFAHHLTSVFDYVLIDSRTGVTDTSGICTMLLPEKVVVVFTPNRQSLSGATDFVRRIADYRRASDDIRPLMIFPLPSRIEPNEPHKKSDWRYGNAALEIEGYQPIFEELFREVYGLKTCDLKEYFDEVQIQYLPPYSYGEEIATLQEVDRLSGRLSLTESYRSFLTRLIESNAPWSAPQHPEHERKLHESQQRLEDAKKELEHRTSFVNRLKAGSLVAVVALAAVVVFTHESYTSYTARSQVSEAFSYGAFFKVAVAEYFARFGRLPSSNEDMQLTPGNLGLPTKVVESAEVTPGGVVTLHFGQDVPKIGGKTIMFTPKANKSGPTASLEWTCSSDTIDSRLLPGPCRVE